MAEGNPLFVEQLFAMLADGAPSDEVPATIQALLAARLDALPEEEREIVERASIIGLDFEWEALGELAADGRRPSGPRLAALVRKELIRPHEAIDDTFRFRHMLIRDAAYDRIPKALRADLHERFAGWLDGRGEEFEEIIGYHLEQAHTCLAELGSKTERTRDLAERAGGHLAASGRRAYERGDLSAAADLLGRAERLLPPDGAARLLPSADARLGADRSGQVGTRERPCCRRRSEKGKASGELGIVASATVADLFLFLHYGPACEPCGDARTELEDAIRVFESMERPGGARERVATCGGSDDGSGAARRTRAIGRSRASRGLRSRSGRLGRWKRRFCAACSQLRVMARLPVGEMEELVDDFARRASRARTRLEMTALATRAEIAAMRDDHGRRGHVH